MAQKDDSRKKLKRQEVEKSKMGKDRAAAGYSAFRVFNESTVRPCELPFHTASAAESSPPLAKAPPPPTDAPPSAGTADVQTDPAEISRTLEQLRELGELKDAGYLTDEEFERLKQRILDRRF